MHAKLKFSAAEFGISVKEKTLLEVFVHPTT